MKIEKAYLLARTGIGAGLLLAVLMVATLAGAPAMAESDLCKAIALTDASGWVGENRSAPPDIVIHKGDTYDEISTYSEDQKTGMGSFCTHGGGCVDRYVIRNGAKVEALRLKNCSIKKAAHPSPYADGLEFDLVLDRSKVDAPTLRYSDVDARLVQLGMCNACADNAANEYIHHPQSACSQTVKSALEGDPEAAQDLSALDDSGPCKAVHPPASGAASFTADNAAPHGATAAATTSSDTPSPALTPPPNSHSASKVMVVILIVVLGAALYFLPTIIAVARRKRNMPAILALNLLLGWTFLGWVASLVWSVVRDDANAAIAPESP